MSIEKELIDSIYKRLTGQDSYGNALKVNGSKIRIYSISSGTDPASPRVLIDMPRTRGEETIDGKEKKEVRQSLRVHTEYPKRKGGNTFAYQIAEAIDDHLEAEPFMVDGVQRFVPQPDLIPQEKYDLSGKQSLDVISQYTFQL